MTKAKQENVWLSLIINIGLPIYILSNLSDADKLGPVPALGLALSLPLVYGIYRVLKTKEVNFISIFGLVSVAVSGGLGLMKVDGFWFAVKEAAFPALIGIFVLASTYSKNPVIYKMFFNDKTIDMPAIDAKLTEEKQKIQLSELLRKGNIYLSFSFFVSAVLNYILAVYTIKSPGGTPEFNAELARMNALSFPVIALPSLALLLLGMFIFQKKFKAISGEDMTSFIRGK